MNGFMIGFMNRFMIGFMNSFMNDRGSGALHHLSELGMSDHSRPSFSESLEDDPPAQRLTREGGEDHLDRDGCEERDGGEESSELELSPLREELPDREREKPRDEDDERGIRSPHSLNRFFHEKGSLLNEDVCVCEVE